MTALSQLKLGLAAIGVILFAYGARADVNYLRWTGIAFLAAAVALRFWRRRPPQDGEQGKPPHG
jgi:hypothetical protein